MVWCWKSLNLFLEVKLTCTVKSRSNTNRSKTSPHLTRSKVVPRFFFRLYLFGRNLFNTIFIFLSDFLFTSPALRYFIDLIENFQIKELFFLILRRDMSTNIILLLYFHTFCFCCRPAKRAILHLSRELSRFAVLWE